MKYFFSVVLLFACFAGMAQVTNEFEPRSWSLVQKSAVQSNPVILPAVDVEALRAEDRLNAQTKLDKSLRVGHEIKVDMDLYNSGSWKILDNGDRIWTLNLKSTGAEFTRVIFDLYSLPEGGELYLYNDERSDKIGPYSYTENQENGVLATWIIRGDNLWLEYYEPKTVKGLGRLNLESVTHGYVPFNQNKKSFEKLNESGNCNVDVLCNPNLGSTNSKDWSTTRNDHLNSVAQILFPRGMDTFVCSGALVNNAAQNGTPYLLTANHCVGSIAAENRPNTKQPNGVGATFDATGWSFGFQWFTTTPDCATTNPTVGPNRPVHIISGAVLRANNDNSDMALFELNQRPPAAWNLFYAGWNNNAVSVPSAELGMHHPAGDIMKLARNDEVSTRTSFDFNGNANTNVWLIDNWEYGVTEGGSSGSPLINQNDQIIGVLSAGSAQCFGTTDNGGFDIYGRLDRNWITGTTPAQRLRDWLDPQNTGVQQLAGIYTNIILSTDDVVPQSSIKIYPNPSTGLFTIESDLPTNYQVYNLNGQLMLTGTTGAATDQLDLSGVASGLYFVKINVGEQTITRKLVKQ